MGDQDAYEGAWEGGGGLGLVLVVVEVRWGDGGYLVAAIDVDCGEGGVGRHHGVAEVELCVARLGHDGLRHGVGEADARSRYPVVPTRRSRSAVRHLVVMD